MKKTKILALTATAILLLAALLTFGYINRNREAREPYEPAPTIVKIEPPEEPLYIEEPIEEIVRERQWILREEIAQLRQYYNNDDIVGYLYIEGTSISYPVVQSDDNVFYLYHDIHKARNVTGWIFLDYENDIMEENRNTIIYGHNMRQDIQFHSIRRFFDREFFDNHRYITFNTAYGEYRWEIFSFYHTSIDFFYIQVDFETDDEFYELLAEMKARSMHESGLEVGEGDRVLTLSTCANDHVNNRLVVNARLIQETDITVYTP